MHIGRSHHTALQIAISITGGFTASFLTFVVSSYVQVGGMRGQLVAGDPNLNRQLPTTLNTFQGAIDGNNAILHSMSSYGWWTMVVLGGIVASFIAFKFVRRYV